MFRHLAAVATALAVVTVTPVEATPALVPAVDRDVAFTADGTTAYGTLHVPEHRAGQRLRAALLLPGSGPTDRDGNQPPASLPDTLAQLADTLGKDGVATLRFDKYGTGRTGLGTYQDRPEELDYPAFVRQARAGYESLRDQPETDPHALLVVGHSEGAMTGLLLGGTVSPRRPAWRCCNHRRSACWTWSRCSSGLRSPKRPDRASSHRSSNAPSTRPSTPPSPPCANADRSTPPIYPPRSPGSSRRSKGRTPGSCEATTPSTHRTPPSRSGREPRCC